MLLLSCVHPGHLECTVRCRVQGVTGTQVIDDAVTVTPMIQQYNRFTGKVDKSDQFISYHCVLSQTICYWKSPFYHLIEVTTTNAFILYNWVRWSVMAN